ncbi:MAG: GatB/YqeY domain-containing protein [Acholeplasmatales bacterium]|nr:GatB/YqeY domain-containing protein [Acholeplasmatales bacterium]
MLFDDLKKAKMQAMKDHDAEARSVLESVISRSMLQQVELKANGKELTDSDVLNNIQKVVKELEEEKAGFQTAGRNEIVAELSKKIEFISKFLPKQLTEEEIKNIISTLEDKSIPAVMKHFKTNYNGQCDMGLVSRIAKNA